MKLWKLIAVLTGIAIAGAIVCAICLHSARQMRQRATCGKERLEMLRREARAEDAARRADSLDRLLTTPDLALHEVHGRVERIEYPGYTVTFDRDGNLTSPGLDADSIMRGSNRLLTTHLEYTRNGRRYTSRLFYDHHDRLTRKSTTVTTADGSYEIYNRYDGYQTDSRGNWIRRRCVITSHYGRAVADSLGGAVATQDSIETRKIIYYR